MAHVRLEEVIDMSQNSVHLPNTNESSSSQGLLMTHSSGGARTTPTINMRGFNCGARTMEHSRMFANNITSRIEEIRPLIESARVSPGISFSSLLNIQRPVRTVPASPESYEINIEDESVNGESSHNSPLHDHQNHQTTATDNFLNNIREAANGVASGSQHNHGSSNNINNHNNGNGNNTVEESTETVRINPETRTPVNVFDKYVPFLSMLLIKGIYDHRVGILNLIVLLVTFSHANNVLKREIAKQHNRSWTWLLVITCYIVACIAFINFKFESHIFSPFSQPLTIWELLWSVVVTDFVLKLITIICKVILTCLPARLLALQKRGKYYLMVEATSQLFRCVAPIQPWLYYFSEAYQGAEKMFAVFFSVFYAVNKGNDLLDRVQLFCKAVWKLVQNVNLGVSPSKEQLIASGGICAICHEEYSTPVRLHCTHIFCEICVSTWLDRERSCPLCRAEITDDPIYRDGHTTYFTQLY